MLSVEGSQLPRELQHGSRFDGEFEAPLPLRWQHESSLDAAFFFFYDPATSTGNFSLRGV